MQDAAATVFHSIIDLLRAHRLDDYRYRAKCPVHQGKSDSSLSIKLAGSGADSRILLFCHARCDFRDIMSAIGYKPGDMFAGGKPSPRQKTHSSALRALDLWCNAFQIHCASLLRDADVAIRAADSILVRFLECEAPWGLLAQGYRIRQTYGPVYQILISGSQQEKIDLWRRWAK